MSPDIINIGDDCGRISSVELDTLEGIRLALDAIVKLKALEIMGAAPHNKAQKIDNIIMPYFDAKNRLGLI